MRILFLCKRQYTGRDLLKDRYGRLYELPVALAARGHAVTVIASSYRRRGPLDRDERGVRWCSRDVLPWPPAVLAAWQQAGHSAKPDVVVASSDAMHLVAGSHFAHRLGVPVVLDLYDDYEAFGLTCLPGLRAALRASCVRADAVLAVSGSLATMLPARGVDPRRLHVLGNGVPDGFAVDIDKAAARRRLGLPLDVPLIGTAGALTFARGIGDLLSAAERLRAQHADVRLAVAGPRDGALTKALPEGTIDLGHLAHADVPVMLRALDVGVVCNRDGAFARACHPMKLVEMAAIGTPVVAADIGEVSLLLADRPDALYPTGDAIALAARIAGQLAQPRPLDPRLAKTWPELAGSLESVLRKVAGNF